MPAPVEPAERLLHRVLGGGPVAEHDDGQPDQPEGVRPVQRGYRLGRRRCGDRGRLRQVRCVGFHVSETHAPRSGCVCGTKVRVFTPPSPVESRVTTRRRVLRGAGSVEARL